MAHNPCTSSSGGWHIHGTYMYMHTVYIHIKKIPKLLHRNAPSFLDSEPQEAASGESLFPPGPDGCGNSAGIGTRVCGPAKAWEGVTECVTGCVGTGVILPEPRQGPWDMEAQEC